MDKTLILSILFSGGTGTVSVTTTSFTWHLGDTLDRRAGENRVSAAGIDLFGAPLQQGVNDSHQRAGGIDFFIDDKGRFTLHIADDIEQSRSYRDCRCAFFP